MTKFVKCFALANSNAPYYEGNTAPNEVSYQFLMVMLAFRFKVFREEYIHMHPAVYGLTRVILTSLGLKVNTLNA